ncbi:hypothetical protein DFJ74DRAFT_673025 [Hyaloraphidium curvatum]|nr:hypothetical protein DFJ74DRAFT_673025 [Hyaloraphidium curvatum]
MAHVPSMDVIELSKENILPLPSGRRATVLTAVLAGKDEPATPARGAAPNPVSPSQAPNPALEALRLDFERQVADPALLDSDDDPLEIHYRYVRWLLEHYTSGNNASSRTLSVLERTLETFKRDGRYRNDPRHLRLWLTYKDMVRDPLDVFRWLHTNDILQELAGFYEGWAGCLESKGRYKDADAMYQLGIHRRAQPLERLQRRYLEFQRRMMTTSAPPEDEVAEDSQVQRTALGTVPARTAAVGNENSRDRNPARPQAQQQSRQPAAPNSTRSGKLAIFSDPEGTTAAGSSSGSTWPELGTSQQRNRENVRDKEKWTDVKVPALASGPTGKLQVWSDQDASAPESGLNPLPSSSAPVLREKLVAVDGHHGLLSSMDAAAPEAPKASAPKSAATSKAPSKRSASHPQQPAAERAAVAYHLVYPAAAKISFEDGASGAKKCEDEKSFEEIRAERRYGLLGYVSESEGDSAGEEEEAGTATGQYDDHVVLLKDDGHLDSTVTMTFRDKRKSVASPTINTKKAMRDVYEMFSGDIEDDDPYAVPEEDDTRPVLAFQPPQAIKKVSIFQDSEPFAEPAGPSRSKLPVFRDEPAPPRVQQPGKAKFAVFADEPPDENRPQHLAPRQPLGIRSDGGSSVSPTDTEAAGKPPVLGRTAAKPLGNRPRSFEVDEEDNPFAAPSTSMRGSGSASSEEDMDTIPASNGFPLSARNPSLTRQEVQGLVRDLAADAADDGEHLIETDDAHAEDEAALQDAQERLQAERERFMEMQQIQAMHTGGVLVPLGPRIPDMPALYDPSLTPITERTEPSSRATCTTAANSSLAMSSVPSGTGGRPSIAHERTFARDEGEPTSTLSLTRVLKTGLQGEILEEEEEEQQRDEAAEVASRMKQLRLTGPADPFAEEAMQRYVSDCMEADEKAIAHHSKPLLQRGARFAPNAEIHIPGSSDTLVIERKLGEGGYGVVFLATNIDRDSPGSESDASDDDSASRGFSLRFDRDPSISSVSGSRSLRRTKGLRTTRAVKVANTRSKSINLAYEHCLLRTARARLAAAGSAAALSLISVYDCQVFSDAAILRMEYASGGTLLDLVNAAMTADTLMTHVPPGQGTGMDEPVAMFYAIEAIKVIDALHGVGIVHGDVKPENFLARWSKAGSRPATEDADISRSSVRVVPDEWTSIYDPSGGGGWGDRGLLVLDFGRALDLSTWKARFDDGDERNFVTEFESSGNGDPAVESWELRNKRPFHGFELDWYGLAGVMHVLLFGRFMEVTEGESAADSEKPHLSIAALGSMKRYWQTDEIWAPLFSALLNPPEPFPTAGREALRGMLAKMQRWLELNCTRNGKNLRASLKKLELAMTEKNKRSAPAGRALGAGARGGGLALRR